jgi:chromate transport protein ChrA
MPLLRILLAGLVALVAMAAVFFTAAIVLFTGLVGWLVQLFRGRPAPARSTRPPNRVVSRPGDDVIDVVTTKVPDEPGGR